MININIDIVIKRIKKIQSINDELLLRYEMYSIFTEIILSKEQFKKNNDISNFLECFDIRFKEYVLGTRTLILAKTLRVIEKAEYETLCKYKKTLLKMLDESVKIENNKSDTSAKYITNILNKYSRNKGK